MGDMNTNAKRVVDEATAATVYVTPLALLTSAETEMAVEALLVYEGARGPFYDLDFKKKWEALVLKLDPNALSDRG